CILTNSQMKTRRSDLFAAVSVDTPWEWARARRRWFNSPVKDALGAAATAIGASYFSRAVGRADWPMVLLQGVFGAVVGRAGLPFLETLFWLARRNGILKSEEIERLQQERGTVGSESHGHTPSADAWEKLYARFGKYDGELEAEWTVEDAGAVVW